ncbi:hypothetical protein PAMA111031_11835 [Paraphotobacterium marinum]
MPLSPCCVKKLEFEGTVSKPIPFSSSSTSGTPSPSVSVQPFELTGLPTGVFGQSSSSLPTPSPSSSTNIHPSSLTLELSGVSGQLSLSSFTPSPSSSSSVLSQMPSPSVSKFVASNRHGSVLSGSPSSSLSVSK